MGDLRRRSSKETNHSEMLVNSRDLMHSFIIIVNTILYTSNWLKTSILNGLTTKKEIIKNKIKKKEIIIMGCDGGVSVTW